MVLLAFIRKRNVLSVKNGIFAKTSIFSPSLAMTFMCKWMDDPRDVIYNLRK